MYFSSLVVLFRQCWPAFGGIHVLALVQCLKSDLIQESEPEDLLLSPLTLATPLTLILLIKPLPLTLKSDVICDIGPGLLLETICNLFQIIWKWFQLFWN